MSVTTENDTESTWSRALGWALWVPVIVFLAIVVLVIVFPFPFSL